MNKIFKTPQGITEAILSSNFDVKDGPLVVMIPSASGNPFDYSIVSERLAQDGWRTAFVYPRGFGKSDGKFEGITLHDLAKDIARIVEQVDTKPAHIIGHLIGSKIARCLAVGRPELVRCLILLGTGGKIPPTAKAADAMKKLGTELTLDERKIYYKTAFLAKNSDPAVVMKGGYHGSPRFMIAATQATPLDEWWDGGNAPMLVIQGEEDIAAPVQNGEILHHENKDRVTLVNIPDAAHQMLIEQPEIIAKLVINYIRKF